MIWSDMVRAGLVTAMLGLGVTDCWGADMADRSVLDPQLLAFVESIEKNPTDAAAAGPVDVLIAVEPATRDEVVSGMQALGLNVGTVAGDIVSGRAPASALVSISELPGVVKMELGSPQMPEDAEPLDYTE